MRKITYREAILEAQRIALDNDPAVFLFGEGVGGPSGVFKTTAGLKEEFGLRRVMDVPVCENTLTGIAVGAALAGMKPVLIHMFTDFMLMAMDQIVNHAAKYKYVFGGKTGVPLTIRAIIGGREGAGAQHSQPIQALLSHIPGLKVVMPSSAYDAKGLLLASIADSSPVIFIEHSWLYDQEEPVPEGVYLLPLGKAVVKRSGRGITIVADSVMVPMALAASSALDKEGIDAEVIDLRTVKPLDYETIRASVKKTHRACVLDFGYKCCGIGSEVAAFLAEECFDSLKGPVIRIALPDIPLPASPALEALYYPSVDEIITKVRGAFHRV
ncbi:MAG: alpha-ketoacid dehydrogenase subunit beta [Candidatus Omnitrophica bacterium]|nr:alpha-ketoacid dehydrogenase subunit beta [Candidatus Omnitrophota bacterium]